MTATAEFLGENKTASTTLGMIHAGKYMTRCAQRFMGIALAGVALGLWIMPGSDYASGVMLFKLGLSVTLALLAIGLLSASAKPRSIEIEIDSAAREVRLVRPQMCGRVATIETCRFRDLSQVQYDGMSLHLWDDKGGFLAEVAPSDRTALNRMVEALRDEGKLD